MSRKTHGYAASRATSSSLVRIAEPWKQRAISGSPQPASNTASANRLTPPRISQNGLSMRSAVRASGLHCKDRDAFHRDDASLPLAGQLVLHARFAILLEAAHLLPLEHQRVAG